jgi:hypothetical protein
MAQQIVMDHTGDTRHDFDVKDRISLDAAEKRFMELTGKGFRAVALSDDGSPGTLMKGFDPAVERTLFIPNLQGG